MWLPGIVQYRRCTWMGHILRLDESSLVRQSVLRYAELVSRALCSGDGSILKDALAFNSAEMLVWLAGGSGSEEDRKENRKRWRVQAMMCLAPADKERRKKKKAGATVAKTLAVNRTKEEIRLAFVAVDHDWRIYTDGGADGNGAGGDWGEAGFSCLQGRQRPDDRV